MAKKSQSVVRSVKPTTKPVDETPDKLASIRQLLFGEEVERLENSMTQQQKLFTERLSGLEALIKTTSAQIEKQIQSAVSELNRAVDNHHNEHIQQEGKLEQKIIDFSSRLKEFQSHTKHDLTEAHNELDLTAKQIYQSLEKEIKRLSIKIEKTSQELSSNKADRKTLATLLESMASNLNDSQE